MANLQFETKFPKSELIGIARIDNRWFTYMNLAGNDAIDELQLLFINVYSVPKVYM